MLLQVEQLGEYDVTTNNVATRSIIRAAPMLRKY